MLLFRWIQAQSMSMEIYLLLLVAAAVIAAGIIALRYRLKRKNDICKTLKTFQISDDLSISECELNIKNLAKSKLKLKTKSYNFEIRSIIKNADKKLNQLRAQLESTPPNIIALVPAARWLFDNFYIIYREIKKDEKNIAVHRNIPIITRGEYKGYPRVFLLVKEIVANLGFHLSRSYINKMIDAYQEITPLTSSELLFIPDLMGLCLVEGVLNASNDILEVVKIKRMADEYVQEVIAGLNENSENNKTVRSGASKSCVNSNTFISHVLYSLKKVAIDEDVLNEFINSLSGVKEEINTANIFHDEQNFETQLESSIRSKVQSIKIINRLNKSRLFERHSMIEKYLSQDPSGVYRKMDDDSRNLYRWAVEKLAVKAKKEEWEVADAVLGIAKKNEKNKEVPYPNHVGTYLVGSSKGMLKAELAKKATKRISSSNKLKNVLYFVIIALFTLILLSAIVWLIMLNNVAMNVYAYLFLFAAFFPVMGIAIELTNHIFNNLVPTVRLPAMDYTAAIPSDHRTIVVIPVILSGKQQLEKYISRLEKYYLANPQENLHFSILADFKDADKRQLPEDEEIIETAVKGFSALNEKYPSRKTRFGFFIRYRQWNEKESCWMGWERKRGKLEEFNALLFGEKDTSFMDVNGFNFAALDFKYVITIDADTDLIRGSASKLVGIIAHPLNRPVINPKNGKVERGYVIVQSQIRNHVDFSNRSIFSKVFAGQQGIDAYSNVVSDIYQDTFEAGTFLGKGIYDLKAMHQLLYKTLPENSVLSHDLLESCYAKCAFAGNVELMDTHPSSVIAYSKREHRWIRGDWQLLPWLFGRDSLGGLSRWKIFDNMRRSLVAFCRLLVIILNAFLLPDSFFIWIPIVFFGEFLRLTHLLFETVVGRIIQPMSKIAFKSLANAAYIILEQAAFRFMLLPYRTWISLDAILRTLYRLFISKKQLLEWETAEAAESSSSNKFSGYLKMLKAILPASALLVFASYLPNSSLFEKAGFLAVAAIWLLSPVVSFLISVANKKSAPKIPDAEDCSIIRLSARRTWQYFLDFFTQDNNYLCPDNYQMYPDEKESAKTSPTNIGLQLMSFMSARDLGYTGLTSLVEGLEKTIATVEKMEKWNGHLFNWYNTKTLEVLYPRYVSAVDSGNFVSYLIAVKNGLMSMLDCPIIPEPILNGFKDVKELAEVESLMPESFATVHELEVFINRIKKQLKTQKRKPWEKQHWVDNFLSQCEQISKDIELINVKNIGFYNQKSLLEEADSGSASAKKMALRITALIKTMERIVSESKFSTLFNKNRSLFYIGFNASSQRYDTGNYDLLASEAMLTSYLAIAKNEVSKKHWLKLGRPLTMSGGNPVFVSWSGTMFEYLMPYLVLKEFPGSVYSTTARAAVREQIAYGRKQNIPWGISESQYYRFDVQSNYQYKAFGIPKLSQQPHLDKSLVVAPYATLLALQFDYKKAIKNMQRLREIGAYGEYGFYEAVDYNSPDTESMNEYSVVKCYMTHHQGMGLVSINNLLNNDIMRKRFHREPMIKSAEVMLEEVRASHVVPISKEGYSIEPKQAIKQKETGEYRYVLRTNPSVPRTLWLSNNRYCLLLTSDGDGFSKRKNLMVNRWTSDTDSFSGQYIYIKETDTGKYWSAAYKPTMKEPDEYKVLFSASKAEYHRRDGDISTLTEVTLSPLKDVELRRVTLTNHSLKPYRIETTSYMEVVMDDFHAGLMHPAFNKLFIESETVNNGSVLICKRRKGEHSTQNPYLFHMVKTNAKRYNDDEYDTDRQRFIGRNNTLKSPDALTGNVPLANSAGFSIDPVMSVRAKIVVPAGRSVTVTYITGVCDTKKEAINAGEEYDNYFNISEAFRQFEQNSDLEIKYLDLTEKKVNVIQDLIGPVHYPSRLYRADKLTIAKNMLGQNGLWRFGISGDNPIILYKVKSTSEYSVANDVLKAYEYMRINEINVDLVILDDEEAGYFQDVRSMLAGMLGSLRVYVENHEKPSLFIINSSQINEEELNLLMAAARIVFTEETGIYFRSAERETGWRRFRVDELPKLIEEKPMEETHHASAKPNLEYYNGYGGFAKGGKEYQIYLDSSKKTPMPWSNVIANDNMGFIVTESGGGYTWAQNSSENKLTTWSNDPVSDPKSELIYIQDKTSGKTSYPVRYGENAKGEYTVRHGFGYSIFSHSDDELAQTLTMFVPEKDPVKLWLMEVENNSVKRKDVYVTLHLKWDLGRHRELTAPFIVTEFDKKNGYLSARNTYSNVYRQNSAFIFSSEKITSYTGDRHEYIENKAHLDKKEAGYSRYSNTVGAGYDPCGTVQIALSIKPGEKAEFVFGLGYTDTQKRMEALGNKYSKIKTAQNALKNIQMYWKRITEKVSVTSHNRGLDFMANGWLIYQAYSCRIKARAAFYQAGGAYGFRDQLQDSLALIYADAKAARAQILTVCASQFEEGDVMHWWHPPLGEGVRTRISDDYLWLPYVVAAYVKQTGDYSLLKEEVPYLSAPPLEPHENEKMMIPQVSNDKDSVYGHCMRALRNVEFGELGLPLMGGGDWNDGMNHVGIEGKGQSVWLGWFVYAVSSEFIKIAEHEKDRKSAKLLAEYMKNIKQKIEKHAWDGRWYARAFYDDGTKIGSKESPECMIDSISQSWSVISGAAKKDRAKKALDSAVEHLLKKKENLLLLLAPPFDKTENYPGYIQDYFPGIRENGGQYTHAAVWMAISEMMVGNNDTGLDILSVLNPIYSTLSERDAIKYAKEPYVLAGDVYYAENYKGFGGWSWYTGAAGWMYQAILKWFLGLKQEGDTLTLEPSVPANFGSYTLKYKYGTSVYVIDVPNIEKGSYTINSLTVDGEVLKSGTFNLIDDGKRHYVHVDVG